MSARAGRAMRGSRAVVFALAMGAVAWLGSTGLAPAQDSSSAPAATAVPASPATSTADLDQLRERAATFWAARVAGDSKAQWDLLEPRGRGRITPGEYVAVRGAVKYLAYQVEDATVDGYFGTVKVRLLVQMLPPTVQQRRKIAPSGALINDRWVKVGGTWYRSVEQEEPNEAAPQ
jgi:hypothetical protein